MAKKGKLSYAVAQNVAAISLEMGGNKALWNWAYDAIQKGDGGTTDIVDSILDVSAALEDVIEKDKLKWGEDVEWMDTVEKLAERLLRFMSGNGNVPTYDECLILARQSLVRF